MTLFEGILLSVLVILLVFICVWFYKQKTQLNEQSRLLIENMKAVSKYISIEGDFAEIYEFEDVKQKFLKLVSSKKKALVVIEAKAFVGFDFKKVEFLAIPESKNIVIKSFPNAEVISITTDIKYYDVKNGMFNKFEAADLTELNEKAKAHILSKVPESDLFSAADQEIMRTLTIMGKLANSVGWQLDVSKFKSNSIQKLKS